MHYFELRNIQHFVLYLLPAVLGVLIFAIGLARTHFRREDADVRMPQVPTTYVGGIEERNAPFPLVLVLIITLLTVSSQVIKTANLNPSESLRQE